jgi:hypothetical protein
MEMTQTVSTPTDAVLDMVKVAGIFVLATIWVELKPERVQESLAADGTEPPVTLTLQLAIHQSQTVTFDFSGPRLAITFDNGDAAPTA